MIHDLDSTRKNLAKSSGINVNDDTNTNVILDDIFNGQTQLTRPSNTWNASFEFAKHNVSHFFLK